MKQHGQQLFYKCISYHIAFNNEWNQNVCLIYFSDLIVFQYVLPDYRMYEVRLVCTYDSTLGEHPCLQNI